MSLTGKVVTIGAPSTALIEAILRAARIEADRKKVPVCVAVVDGGANLAGFVRIPGAFLISIDLAIDKAWTAAGLGMSTRLVGDVLRKMPDAARDGILIRPRLTEVPGGFPLIVDGQPIGAIGVSGGSVEEDEAIAQAGMAVLKEK